jgi:cobalt-zinc-cadmium efflux system outer membrane protein
LYSSLRVDFYVFALHQALIPDYKWADLSNFLPPPVRPLSSTRLIQQLPALQLLNYRVNTAKARINIAKTKTGPDPTISVRGGQEDKKALIGVSLSFPLFVRNNFHDQVIGANQTAIAIDKALQSAYWKAKAHIQGTASRYRLLYRSYKQWRSVSAASLGGGIQLLDKLWNAGELNTTDYLIQLKQHIDNQIAGAELQGQAWQAWIQWLDASASLNHWVGYDVQIHNGDINK